MSNKIKVKDLVEQFELEVLSGESKLENKIQVYGLNRAGLELAGYFEGGNNSHRLILMSTKEYMFMENFDVEERIKRYTNLINSGIPGIIITTKYKDDVLIKVTKENDFPLLRTSLESTSEFTREILEYFDEYFAPSLEIHGSLVNVFGKGVLITGESGIGKSEITLELVKKNHMFVGDDRIVLRRKANKIYGKSHPIISCLVEVRGIGIINIAETHGWQVIMDETTVDVVIELSDFKKNGDDYERLGKQFDNKKYLGKNIPYLKIPVSSGRNVSDILEMAVSQLKVSKSPGYKPAIEVIDERIQESNNEDNND